MTDVEAKSPTKRRISDKGEKKGPANSKKAKITPVKQHKNSNKPNNNAQNNKNLKKNKNTELENGSPKKKLKPFVGTSQIASNEQQEEGSKKVTKQDKPNNEARKPRNKFFVSLKGKIQSDEKESAVKSVDDKIKDIESRDVISKTARKKLKLLYRLKKIADGKSDDNSQQNAAGNKSGMKGRIEGKKKGLEATKTQPGKKEAVKTQVKGVQKKANELNKKQGKPENKQVNKNTKQGTKAAIAEESSDEDEESDNELEEDEDSGESDEVEEEEGGAEGEADSDEDEEDSDENEEDEDDSDEEIIFPQGDKRDKKVPVKKPQKSNEKVNKKKIDGSVNLEDLKNNKLVSKNQKRFVLFVGNIPYDTNKHDLIEHFQKSGEIKHIRIPTEKKSSKPRGFAYVELGNEESYQKCLSMHHTFLKGRRINVLYTQGGKKKGEEKKNEIKAKNFKLHAMRKEGKLAGSKKETQKRSFRRAKQQKAQQKPTELRD